MFVLLVSFSPAAFLSRGDLCRKTLVLSVELRRIWGTQGLTFQTPAGVSGPQNVSVRWASGVRSGDTFPTVALPPGEETTRGLESRCPWPGHPARPQRCLRQHRVHTWLLLPSCQSVLLCLRCPWGLIQVWGRRLRLAMGLGVHPALWPAAACLHPVPGIPPPCGIHLLCRCHLGALSPSDSFQNSVLSACSD